ncbi:MAG: glycosyl hydrolase family 65 protein, partial [Chloroflexota bacterium]
QIARKLLQFRIWTLPQARARATEMAERGALFPWRTINGHEASAYYPAGTAQYHINADIALGLVRYVGATGDRSILLDGGAELMFETARLWMSLGATIEARGGAFCINGVTGPDEYTALVDNNTYTNLMAQAHLRHAARMSDDLAAQEPAAFARIAATLGLQPEEVAAWRSAADRMRVPRDPALGIHAQDDSFLGLERWDFASTPPDHYPLLLHYHPLVIYRHQVLKQPDVVLAQVLLAHEFTSAEKRRNFAYYDPLTTGDSSLAPCIQSVAAAELGYADSAYDYFMRTARMDLDDINGNVEHGVHIAAMAGSWVSLVYGFAGLRDDDGILSFAPRVPASWRRLAFRIGAAATCLRVEVTPTSAVYEVESGPAITMRHFAEEITVHPAQPAVFDLRPRLRGVVFDLDGVLTDTAELHYRAWQRLADEEGMAFDRSVNERLRGIGRMDSLQIMLEHAGRTGDSDAQKLSLAERKNSYFRELIAGVTPADLFPGIAELLADLRAWRACGSAWRRPATMRPRWCGAWASSS